MASSEEINGNGTIHSPAFDIPLSSYMSVEAQKVSIEQLMNPIPAPVVPETVDNIMRSRENLDKFFFSPCLDRMKAIYPVTIETKKVEEVSVYIVTPKDYLSKSHGDEKILINLHGGNFSMGSGMGQLVESIPVASVCKTKVISIDYRQAPEFKFPAASEDVAAVYKVLLGSHEPKNIGIYGCSAGALLTAMTMAWLQKAKLPLPAAIGLFFAGADPAFGGDSIYTGQSLSGKNPPPPSPNPPAWPMAYLSETDLKSPLVSPAFFPALLANFPPTLLISGTRAFDMSSVIFTHNQLVKAGVEADLHIWDGMRHAFFYNPDMPESKEVYDVIANFFDRHFR